MSKLSSLVIELGADEMDFSDVSVEVFSPKLIWFSCRSFRGGMSASEILLSSSVA